MKKYFLIFLFFSFYVFAQVENISITHPVYDFILRLENRGVLKNFSSADFPLSRKQITNALKTAEDFKNELTNSELKTLQLYSKEFEVSNRKNAVLFKSPSDNQQVFSSRFFSDDEKFIYHFADEKHNISIKPLFNLDIYSEMQDDANDFFSISNLGFIMYGTLDSMFGYNLQVTNGRLINGNRELALQDKYYSTNFKFAGLDSDIDFTESHLRFEYEWFYAGIGRERRLMGSGMNEKIFLSDNSLAFDAITLGADFKHFKYKFLHGSLLNLPDSGKYDYGFRGELDPKYIALHKFTATPSWGEVSFWESIIYSRPMDIAYLNPLSFFKSLEHALRDRDNSLMGVDITVRPLKNLQLKSSFMMDDMIFEEIGNGFWGNKTAFNAAVQYVFPFSIDAGFEYSRVEPFTYSHFNIHNSYTNSEKMLAADILPNSDKYALNINWWWGGRYPLKLRAFYLRHGRNIYDDEGNLIKNVGGDPLQTHSPEAPDFVKLLDGEKVYIFDSSIEAGFEFFRGFNMKGKIGYRTINSDAIPYLRLIIGIYDI
jgi:hypothetical protein